MRIGRFDGVPLTLIFSAWSVSLMADHNDRGIVGIVHPPGHSQYRHIRAKKALVEMGCCNRSPSNFQRPLAAVHY